ncbi:MAG: hypothetical protein KAU26_04460, partial [Methylococcales bacterium]|nr:hypothetical protein [Methylococcales bacterium]
VAISHPSLINNLFEEGANFLGINSPMMKVVAWASLIFLLLYPLSWLFIFFIHPSIWLIQLFIGWVIRLDAFLRGCDVSAKVAMIEKD